MGSSVDNRVVSMDFDNRSFEQNVGTSLTSLDKLKKSLDFSESKKGLDGISEASKAFHLNGIATAVDGIANKFTTMGAVAFATITNITNRAITAGERIVKSFTIAPVKQGFAEYELKLGAIQTIMAGTGESLDAVNAKLEELNAYSDKTIYSFSDMTSNIGKFTNAGVSLNESVAAIQGIANEAALAGANAGEAARAMYNFGQAMSTGSVRLIDWKSIELANMATNEFKTQLLEGAVAAGTLTKGVDGLYKTLEGTPVSATKGFNDSLEQQWLTSTVLTKVLGDYADATTDIGRRATDAAQDVKTFTQMISTIRESIGSGWSKSFEIFFGDFEEAKTLWTGMNNVISGFIGKSADARNELIQGWKDIGGRTFLIEGLKKGLEGLGEILGTIGKAFRDVFPKMTSERLLRLTLEIGHLMEKLNLSGRALTAIRSLFEGLFSVVKIGVEIFKGVGRVVGAFFSGLSKMGESSGGILKFLWSFGESLTSLRETLVDDGAIERFFDKFTGYASDLGAAVNVIFRWLTVLKDALISIFDGSASSGLDAFSDAANRVRDRFAPLIDMFKSIGDAFVNILARIGITRESLARFGDFIKDTFAAIPQAISDIFAKTNYDQALDTVNTGLLAGFVLLFKKFMSDGVLGSSGMMKSITGAFDQLTGVLSSMQMKVKSEAIMKIAIALGILTASLVILSMIDSGKLTKAMIAVGVGMKILAGSMLIMNEMIANPKDAAKLGVLAGSLIAMSTAMLLFAFAAKTLSTMGWEELAKGLGGLALTLAVVIKGLDFITTNTKGLITAGLAMIAIAVALNILAGAVKLFSMMSYSEIGRGLVGIAGGLAAIVLAVNLMPNGPGMVFKGAGVLAIAVAMNVLAGAVKLFSMMDLEQLGKGIGAIALTLLAIAGATQLMPNGVNLSLQGVGLLAIGVGLVAMAKAIQMLGGMSWTELAKGLGSLAITLNLLAGAAFVMQEAIGGAIAIGIMSGSLWFLAKGLQEFSEVEWVDLLKGLIGLGATLAILGVSASAMSAFIPALLGLGAALLLVGAAFALFGVGANLVATAFAVLATSGTQGVEVLAGALTMLVKAIPPLLVALGEGIIKLGMKLVEAAPQFVVKMGEVIGALLQVIIDNMPKFGELLIEFIHTGLNAIRETLPDIITTGMEILLSLLGGIKDNISKITSTVIDIILKFTEALTERMPELVTAGLGLLVSFLNGIAENLGLVVAAVANILTTFITEIGKFADDMVLAGVNALTSFLTGIGKAAENIATAVADIMISFVTHIGKEFPRVVTAMFDAFIKMINDLAEAIRTKSGKLGEAFGNLAAALATAFLEAGKGALKGFIDGITPGDGVDIQGLINKKNQAEANQETTNTPTNTGRSVVNGIAKTVSKMSEAITKDMDMRPVVTPVLDLTAFSKDLGRMNGLMTNTQPVMATLSRGQAEVLAKYTGDSARQRTDNTPVVKEIKFEQKNYSPEALSTSDIYRLTSNQIAVAKKELALL